MHLDDAKAKRKTLLSVEPRVVRDRLLLPAVQRWVMFDKDDLSAVTEDPYVVLCSYVNRYPGHSQEMVNILSCKQNHHEPRRDCRICGKNLQRGYCALEFCVEVRRLHNRRGKTLAITKWLDLGCGENANDENWRRHLFGP